MNPIFLLTSCWLFSKSVVCLSVLQMINYKIVGTILCVSIYLYLLEKQSGREGKREIYPLIVLPKFLQRPSEAQDARAANRSPWLTSGTQALGPPSADSQDALPEAGHK